ncbi:MAG: hypothetical protein ACHQT8_03570 [Chlamydiales bacterium]
MSVFEHPRIAEIVPTNISMSMWCGEALNSYLMLAPGAGASFCGCFSMGAWIVAAVDWRISVTDVLGNSILARVIRLALYILTGIAIASVVVALAGFSITVTDIAIMTGELIVLNSAIGGLAVAIEKFS